MSSPFPHFTPLNISHRNRVEEITSRFPPYSDFNFASLLCWNTDGSTKLCFLGENLVIEITDYCSTKPIYSFIGNDNPDKAVLEILNCFGEINLVPEAVIKKLSEPEKILSLEDRDNFDYIYEISALATPSRNKRKKLKRFSQEVGDKITTEYHNKLTNTLRVELISVFMQWVEQSPVPNDATQELNAFQNLLQNFEHFDFIVTVFRINGKMNAFSIDEPLHDGYVICHFAKALKVHEHMYTFADYKVAENLLGKGFTKINWEQDLGIPGLRTAKLKRQPTEYLKKYTIRPMA